jgi:hypothetical protein
MPTDNMSGDPTSPPPWLPDATPFHPKGWHLLVGEFDVTTAPGPDVGGPGALRTVMRLRATDEPEGVVGSDEDLDTDPAKVSRWPVVLQRDTLHVGTSSAADGPSEYHVRWGSATGFCGEWRTRQPPWLREQQPGHPELASGPFLARRRATRA